MKSHVCMKSMIAWLCFDRGGQRSYLPSLFVLLLSKTNLSCILTDCQRFANSRYEEVSEVIDIETFFRTEILPRPKSWYWANKMITGAFFVSDSCKVVGSETRHADTPIETKWNIFHTAT